MAILQPTTINGDLTVTGSVSFAGGYKLQKTSSSLILASSISVLSSLYNSDQILLGSNIGYGGYGAIAIGYNTRSLGGTNNGGGAIAIGYNAQAGSDVSTESTGAGCIAIGDTAKARYQKSVSIGWNAGSSSSTTAASTNINCPGQSSWKIALGNGSNLLYYSGTTSSGVAITSDYRDKTDFKVIENATKFLSALNPITYVGNDRYDYCNDNNIETFNKKDYLLGTKKGTRRHAGFKAQEVYKALIDIYKDNNYADPVDYNNFDGDKPETEFDKYYMRYEALIPFLVKGFQEQQKVIEELQAEIKKLKNN